MPYLEYLFCEQCGDYARLDIDPSATIESYSKDGRENVSIVQPTLVWDYLIYSCGICGHKYKYTYRDVERRVREYFSSLSTEFKDYFDEVIKKSEDHADIPPSQASKKEIMVKRNTSDRIRNLYTAKT